MFKFNRQETKKEMSKIQKSENEYERQKGELGIVQDSNPKPNVDEFNSNANDFNLDVNIIISTFQERLSSLMTELIIKEATIKQQSNIIKRLKGE